MIKTRNISTTFCWPAISQVMIFFTSIFVVMFFSSSMTFADCRSYFEDSKWNITVKLTGQTYVGEYTSDGKAIAHGLGKDAKEGTWTCEGRTMTVQVDGISVVQKLSEDGLSMTAGCCRLSRIGEAPKTAEIATPESSKGCSGKISIDHIAYTDDNCLSVRNGCGVNVTIKTIKNGKKKPVYSFPVKAGDTVQICTGFGESRYEPIGYIINE